MQDLFPFKFFVGVVEDVADPLKSGRTRVRIFGYHTIDKTILPTSDLPWSVPIMPITSASISGKGTAPVGIVTGSWAVGFWLDDSQQISAIFGTFSGITPSQADMKNSMIFQQAQEREIIKNKNDGILKDSSGNPITDSSGNPIAVAAPDVEGWILGQTSEKYETSGKGSGTISTYNSDDFGGASYGCWQFASYLPEVMLSGKYRKNPNRSPLQIYLAQSKYAYKFLNLKPATGEFDSMWKSLSTDANFKIDQHDYMFTNYYKVMLSSLRRNGMDLTKFGIAVQDCIWSTAIQYGANAVSIFLKPLAEKAQLLDKDIVTLVQDYKYQTVDIYFKSSSQAIRDGIRARCLAEKADLLKLIK